MLINSRDLTGLKVETKSGHYVGRILSYDLDIDTQSVRNYYIKPKLLEGGAFVEEIKVHNKQVVDITKDKMVIMDNVVKYKEINKKEIFVANKISEQG